MNLFARLWACQERSWRTRIRFAVRYVSQWLVLRPRTYVVVGNPDAGQFAVLLERLHWFFAGLSGAEFLIAQAGRWTRFKVDAGQIQPVGSASAAAALLGRVIGKILVYDYDAGWLRLDALLPHKVHVINWTRDFRTSSWRLAASVAPRPFRRLAETYARVDERRRSADVVVLGNGPSAYKVFDPQFEGMDVIVCNTAIKSERLLRERRVVAVGFIDATFFVGPSAYTEAFFGALEKALKAQDFSVYVDHEHEEVVRQHTPGLTRDRTFPIVVNASIPPRASYKSGRVQSTSHSVFTSVLLPLAATYYRRIHLVGFDGKDPAMKNYFWKHSDEFQFNDLLPTVRESDPGFFSKRDYEDYSRRNADEIEHFVKLVEDSGVEVIMAHPSFIEPLNRRFRGPR